MSLPASPEQLDRQRRMRARLGVLVFVAATWGAGWLVVLLLNVVLT